MIHAQIPPEALGRMQRVMQAWVQHGATYIPLPWVAPSSVVQATRPAGTQGQDVDTPHGQLLASGEQAFLWLAQTGELPREGIFIGWTPCFRDEPVFDAHHHYGFVKAEVFSWGLANHDLGEHAHWLARTAFGILSSEGAASAQIVSTGPGSFDLVLAGLEIGSYGHRRVPGMGRPYTYATALAEPRFTQALECLQQHG